MRIPSTRPSSCGFPPEDLLAHYDGLASAALSAKVARHVAECAACRDDFEGMGGNARILQMCLPSIDDVTAREEIFERIADER